MTRPRKFTLQEIRDAQSPGDTAAEVASKVGCSEQTASRRLKELDLQRERGRPSLFTQKQCKGLATAIHEPLAMFADRHKCAVPAMRRAIMEGVHLLWEKDNKLTQGYEIPSNVSDVRIWNVARNAPKRRRLDKDMALKLSSVCSCTPAELVEYLERCQAWHGKIHPDLRTT